MTGNNAANASPTSLAAAPCLFITSARLLRSDKTRTAWTQIALYGIKPKNRNEKQKKNRNKKKTVNYDNHQKYSNGPVELNS